MSEQDDREALANLIPLGFTERDPYRDVYEAADAILAWVAERDQRVRAAARVEVARELEVFELYRAVGEDGRQWMLLRYFYGLTASLEFRVDHLDELKAAIRRYEDVA